MGTHTSRISLWSNRSLITRFLAAFGFLAVAILGALGPVQSASAAIYDPFPEGKSSYNWVNTSTIRATYAQGTGENHVNFLDTNPDDTDHTYYAQWGTAFNALYKGCEGYKDDMLTRTAYIKVVTPASGVNTFIQQRTTTSDGVCPITNRNIILANTAAAPKNLIGSTTGNVSASWINDATISVVNVPSPPVNFTDKDANDNNRTFVSQGVSYCKDGAIDTLTLTSPTAGTLYDVVTPAPSGTQSAAAVACTITAVPITISNPANGTKVTKKCTNNAASCALANSNFAKCAGLNGPFQDGHVCSATGSSTPMPGFAPTAAGDEEGDKVGGDDKQCPSLGDFDFKWAMCPLLITSAHFAGAVDELIEEQLHYDTSIFDRSSDRGKAFYNVWSTFRTLALALVIIAGLIMVVSQGTGMQFFDAYTVRKVLPRLLIAVIAITLSWVLLQFIFTFFNDLGSWIQDIILQPFQAASSSNENKGIAGATGWAAVIGSAFLGSSAYLIAIGPLGLMSLMGTVLLALLVGWFVLTIRNVILTILIIFAPFAIACYILPSTKKVFDFWQNAVQTLSMIIVIIMAMIAAGKALSIVTPNGIMKVLFLLAPYFFLPFAFKLAGGLMSTIFSLANDRGKGGFDRMKNVRTNERKMRGEKWRNGSLWRDNALARPINGLGKRIGAYQSGAGISAFAPTTRGRQARALYDSTLGDKALKSNELLNALQNDDQANAVLGMSGGTLAGLDQAAQDLFRNADGSYDAETGNAAIQRARSVGVNRANALAAAKTSMANKARAFSGGNVQALDRGVRRLARNGEEYQSLAHSLAFFARDKGRADLGGTEWIDYEQGTQPNANPDSTWVQARNTVAAEAAVTPMTQGQQQARMWQVVSDRNMLDGVARTGVGALMGGHDNQTRQSLESLTRIITTSAAGSPERLQAAISLKEIHGNMQAASGSSRDIINQTLFDPGNTRGLRLNPNGSVAQQLADMVGQPGLTGNTLTTMGRTYAEFDPNSAQRAGTP